MCEYPLYGYALVDPTHTVSHAPPCMRVRRLTIHTHKSTIYRLILCNVFFKMTHVLPLPSAQNCDKNALQNKRGRHVLNKIVSLTIVFSVFSFAKICQCTQYLLHHIYKSIKNITMNFGSLTENSLIYCMKLF